MPLGVLHELSEDGPRGSFAANALLFAAGILARLDGPVLWCLHSRDLFAPALARVGLDPRRIVFCESWKDADILPAMEDGLRAPGLAGVVGELKRLPLTPSRRLQLAAEASGVTAFVICRSAEGRSENNAAFLSLAHCACTIAKGRPTLDGPELLARRTSALPWGCASHLDFGGL
ncbi:hypothetical protein P0R28_35165 [Bradyrhizobium yuanmingense]|nr:hypothetical protein [Bradyrhizobium yuanmingense]